MDPAAAEKHSFSAAGGAPIKSVGAAKQKAAPRVAVAARLMRLTVFVVSTAAETSSDVAAAASQLSLRL